MEVEVERQLAELRAQVHAASRRADQAYDALQRARPELDTWRRTLQAAVRELEDEVKALREKLDGGSTR